MRVVLKGIFTVLFACVLVTLSIFYQFNNINEIQGKLTVVERPPLEQQLLEQMSLEQKVGQLFMFGFSGTTLNENITDLIQNKYIGGVLLLGPNIVNNTQLKTLLNDIQTISYIPMFVSIDQEGGIVARLKGDDILTTSQRNMETPEEAYNVSYQRGVLLKELGINMNLAPVVEYITSTTSFLYQRVFRGTKEEVALKSQSSIKGYTDSKIIAVAKHYPGHSNTSVDSHYNLPKVNINNEQWNEYIYTFKYLIDNKSVEVIMVGHILYPNIDSKPSTISSELLTKRLKEDLRYKGILITDDMEMDAIERAGGYGQIAKEALLAGNDILLYSGLPTVQREVYDYIVKSVSNGEIPESTLNEKVLRILRLKASYNLFDFSILKTPEEVKEQLLN